MPRFRTAAATLAAIFVATVLSAQTSSVSGRVANADGGSIANAEATLRALSAPGAPPMPAMPNMPGMNERTARAGSDGSFTFDQVAAGQYVLIVDAPGFERSSQQITVPTSGPPIR
jgi:hypothetical protein